MSKEVGTMLVVASIWIAMGAWTMALLASGRTSSWFRFGGLVFYGFHILTAYAFFYDWSHEIAWAETARETREVTGWDSGVGLLANWILFGILAVDLILHRVRPRAGFRIAVDFLLVFFLVNGAIVFGEGLVRGYGIALVTTLAVTYLIRRLRGRRVRD